MYDTREIFFFKQKTAYEMALHVLWREAVVVPDHRNDRYVDAGKDVLRRAENRQHASDQNENREDYERVRPTKGEVYDPHNNIWSANILRGSAKASFIGTDGDGDATLEWQDCKPTDRSIFSRTCFANGCECL